MQSLRHIFTDVSLRQLRGVAAVAEAGTLAGAAKILHVTPPAIAQQLRIIEDCAGMPLFDRLDGRMVPTEAGREVLNAHARVESTLAACGAEVAALRDGLGGRVSVGVISTAKYFAPHILAGFLGQHPNIKLEIKVGDRDDIIEGIEDYGYDLIIMGRTPDQVVLESVEIGQHPHVVIAPPDHPLAAREKVTFAELKDELFLVRERFSGTRALVERLFEEAGIRNPRRMEIGSNETIKQGVMAGLGIAFISAHTIAAETTAGRLCILEVEGLPIMRQWFIVRRPDKELLPAAKLLWDFVEARGAEFLPRMPTNK
ncbi:MAG: LysR family transcriptional regulator [Myxococcota bacterium]